MQRVAKVDCSTADGMFVLHCLLSNVVTYLEAQLALIREAVLTNVKGLNRGHVAMWDRRPTHSSWASKSNASSGTTSRQAGGAGRSDGSPQAFTLDDVPDSVRMAVYASDERRLGGVAGLTHVRRVSEGRTEMLIDKSGRGLGYAPVRRGAWQTVCVCVCVCVRVCVCVCVCQPL